MIARLPKSRMCSEVELILKEEEPIGILKRLAAFGIGPSIHSKITLDKDQLALLEDTSEILVWFSLLFLEEKVERWAVLFLALLNPLTPEEAKQFADESGLGRKLRGMIRFAKNEAPGIIHRLLSARVISKKFIYDCLNPLPNEVILYLMARAKHNDIKRYISLYFTQLKYVRPLLTGKDLKELGYPPGPLYKQVMDEILERKFVGELLTKADEMSFVLMRFPKS